MMKKLLTRRSPSVKPIFTMPKDLITYKQAAEIFKARGVAKTQRTVRTHVWNNPNICPVYDESYHGKRVSGRDVERLCTHLLKKYPLRLARVKNKGTK